MTALVAAIVLAIVFAIVPAIVFAIVTALVFAIVTGCDSWLFDLLILGLRLRLRLECLNAQS